MTQIPPGLEPIMLTASFGLTALLAAAIWWATGRAGLPAGQRLRTWAVAVAGLFAWQTAAMLLARAGVFLAAPDRLGPQIGFAIVLPVVLVLAGLSVSPTARRVVEATPLPALVAIQVYRVVGVVFLALWATRELPGAFALPAGIGDVAIGLAAPIVGHALTRPRATWRLAAWWNTLGLADLVVAVTTGFLSSPGLAHILAHDAPNRLITAYPLAMVPLYAVPVSLILHVLVLHKLATRTDAKAAMPSVG